MKLVFKSLLLLVAVLTADLQAHEFAPTLLMKRQLQAEARKVDPIPTEVFGEKGNYKLVKKLGNGAFGQVYRAEDEAGQSVAIKFFISWSDGITSEWPNYHDTPIWEDGEEWGLFSFEDEWQAGESLDHPHIVKAFDKGSISIQGEETRFLVLEFIQGKTVGDFPPNSMTHSEALRMSIQFLEALRYALEKNYFYYDVHPWNFMISEDKELKVIDLGSFSNMQTQPYAFAYIGQDFKRVYWVVKTILSKGDRSAEEISDLLAPLKQTIFKTKGLFIEYNNKGLILEIFQEWIDNLQASQLQMAV